MAKKTTTTYKTLHASLNTMSEDELVQELDREMKGAKRMDYISRLLGRLSRLTAQRIKLEVFAALKRGGSKDINALLGRCR